MSQEPSRGTPYWDPYDDDLRRSPYAAWQGLRDDAPLYYNERYDFFALSRFEDVMEASLDASTFSSAKGVTLDTIGTERELASMIELDPPHHDVLRRVVGRWFTPRAIGHLEQRIRTLCAGYLDPLVGRERFDIVGEFTARLPVMVISSLLGFPEEDHDNLRIWSDAQVHREDGEEERSAEALADSDKLHGYYWNTIVERRANPQNDMVSELIAAEMEDLDGTVRGLSDIETMAMIMLISIAGNETVARLLGSSAVVLSNWPDERRRLVEDPSLCDNAVDEMLRFEAPSPTQGRYVARAVELHGQVVPEGSKMLLLTGAAGRDERHYERAHEFDAGRRIDRHLSLGYGAHYCLGAALARLEGRIGLEEMLARFPEFHVEPDDVEYVKTNTVRGPAMCPVTV
ncbi:MAG: cytochrome P450 [Acidimicrobiales bacterium]|nr:cytochrome P450 [Acidimicrobiales bacterium]